MNSVEIEQLKNYLDVKMGILEIKINNGEIQDDASQELLNTYKTYSEEGTTLEELKLCIEDVELALK